MSRKPSSDIASGKQFAEFIRSELEKHNTDLSPVSLRRFSVRAGLSDGYLHMLLRAENPNPVTRAKRLLMFALGISISNPMDDVIPHLLSRGLTTAEKLLSDGHITKAQYHSLELVKQ